MKAAAMEGAAHRGKGCRVSKLRWKRNPEGVGGQEAKCRVLKLGQKRDQVLAQGLQKPNCTTQHGRYIPVCQQIDTRTARYWTVPLIYSIRGCFHPVTVRNNSVMVDFDCRRLLSGNINLATTREEASREKEEERESARRRRRIERTSTPPHPTPPSLNNLNLSGNGETTAGFFVHFSLKAEDTCGLCRVLHRRTKTYAAFDIFIEHRR
ncbi:hypothetical protein BHM03_00021058 [Ensete ventricosum]|nr:hypothetical protein BHM03_00021058 [Ensete ventricosum]